MVDDHVEEQEEAERADLFEQGKIEVAEFKRRVDLETAEPDVRCELGDGDGCRDADHGDRAVAHQQQRQADERVEHNAGQLQNALEQKLLVRADDGIEHG